VPFGLRPGEGGKTPEGEPNIRTHFQCGTKKGGLGEAFRASFSARRGIRGKRTSVNRKKGKIDPLRSGKPTTAQTVLVKKRLTLN